MARSSDLEGGKPNARKRKLNLIYFVDSARTKSLSIPLGRLKVLIACQLFLLAWSVGSIGAIVWLLRGKIELRTQLEDSLTTIFEYESRYDRVYDIAYPADMKPDTTPIAGTGASKDFATDQKLPVPTAADTTRPVETKKPAASDMAANDLKLKTTAPTTTAVAASAAAPVPKSDTATARANQKPVTVVPSVAKEQPAVAATPADSESKSEPKPSKASDAAKSKKDLEVLISITNPVIEPKVNELELRFDLTNRSGQARAEGYLWAVAEFQTVDGRKVFLGAPSEIDVNESGEPRNPQLSASFGIKHYKKKSFSFPYSKQSPGIFTAIRIGVMDKSGSDRTTYHVPIDIRVPQGS